MKKRLLFGVLAALFCLAAVGCGKKEEPLPETTTEEEVYEKTDITMEAAKDDDLRAFLHALDPFTDGGSAGSMEYDYRDTISVRRLLDCMFGQRCCVDYAAYPVAQPVLSGDIMSVPEDALTWTAKHIFHVPDNDGASYTGASPALENGSFVGRITKNDNGVQWYYSDFTIMRASFDGTYYYVQYKRNHDDPSVNGTVYQREYYAVLGKEAIDGKEYWTLYTHSSNGYNYVVADENLTPDVVFEEEKAMIINADTAVTMRTGPSTEYGAISSYNPGVLMMAIGTKGDWTYVHYYDHYGWMYSEFLSEQ